MSNVVEISRRALLHNVAVFRRLCPESLFYAVVKSNAYGHGLPAVVSVLSGHVDGFAVNSASEALSIRKLDTTTPILVMGCSDSLEQWKELSLANEAYAGQVSIVVPSIEALHSLLEAGLKLPFHLKLDTGMSRLGFRSTAWQELLSFLRFGPGHRLFLDYGQGLMTHFSNVEDVTDQAFAQSQLADFRMRSSELLSFFPGLALTMHASASGAALILPEARLGLLRVGISLYGFWPSKETKLSALSVYGRDLPELMPVLQFKTRIVHINTVPAGAYVGYGCTFRTVSETKVAVLPVGYFEGYERALSNRSYVLVGGRRAKLIGRVCMNMIMVDVSHVPSVHVGQDAILVGQQGEEVIAAEELADLTGTIHYEVVTRIHKDIPRLVVE